ncbi:hypothetical protein LU290_00740 [Moraxella nasibovis]|nr:hypothetical protein [Moraxella nasibovis]WFF38808.1 hypothetical protein LU290_00740 [Moraxella nasibovis]
MIIHRSIIWAIFNVLANDGKIVKGLSRATIKKKPPLPIDKGGLDFK